MSAWIRSITGRAYHFVLIAQNKEQARPKRQVAGESPAGDAKFRLDCWIHGLLGSERGR